MNKTRATTTGPGTSATRPLQPAPASRPDLPRRRWATLLALLAAGSLSGPILGPVPAVTAQSGSRPRATDAPVTASADPCATPAPQAWDGGPLPVPDRLSEATPAPIPKRLPARLARLQELARRPRYTELLRDPEGYRGRLVRLVGQVTTIAGDAELGYQLVLSIVRDGDTWVGPVGVTWEGAPPAPGQIIDLVGVADGTAVDREKDGPLIVPMVQGIRMQRRPA